MKSYGNFPQKRQIGTTPEAEAILCKCGHPLSEHKDSGEWADVGLGIACWATKSGPFGHDACECEDFKRAE